MTPPADDAKKLKEEIQLTMLDWMAKLIERRALPWFVFGLTLEGSIEFVYNNVLTHEDIVNFLERALEKIRRGDYGIRFPDTPKP